MFKNQKLNPFFEEITPEEKAFSTMYYDLVIRIYNLMDEKGWSQKELAAALGKKPSEINRWLNGGHNLTLKTIAKLEVALGAPLLHVPIKNTKMVSLKGSVKATSKFTMPSNFEAVKYKQDKHHKIT